MPSAKISGVEGSPASTGMAIGGKHLNWQEKQVAECSEQRTQRSHVTAGIS